MIGGHSGCPDATIPMRAAGLVGVEEELLQALTATARDTSTGSIPNLVVFMMDK